VYSCPNFSSFISSCLPAASPPVSPSISNHHDQSFFALPPILPAVSLVAISNHLHPFSPSQSIRFIFPLTLFIQTLLNSLLPIPPVTSSPICPPYFPQLMFVEGQLILPHLCLKVSY
jgi:hypothetical protein